MVSGMLGFRVWVFLVGFLGLIGLRGIYASVFWSSRL